MRIQIGVGESVTTMVVENLREVEHLIVKLLSRSNTNTPVNVTLTETMPLDLVPSEEDLQLPGYQIRVVKMESRPKQNASIRLDALVTREGDEPVPVTYVINNRKDPLELIRQRFCEYLEEALG